MEQEKVKKFFIKQESIRSAGIITTDNLGKRMCEGKRGYMNRGVWPLEVIIDGEKVTDKGEMRRDYVEIPTLARKLTESSGNYMLWRANIPMNLGVGWYEGRQWFLHPDDKISLERINENKTPLIELSPSSGQVRTNAQSNIGEGHIAVLTPCLGQNKFDEGLLISGTYDPRHLVNLNYRSENDPDTKTLVELAELFTKKRGEYIEKVKEIVHKDKNNPNWSRYPRTLMVIGQKGIEFYSYERDLFTPRDIFEYVKEKSEVGDQFSVFGLVEGGSFSVGLVHERKLYEIGIRENKSYPRPPAGLWLGYLEISESDTKNIMELDISKIPTQNKEN